MRPQVLLVFFSLLMLGNVSTSAAQSSMYLRNSTWQSFNINVQQYGDHALDTSEWAQLAAHRHGWIEDDLEIFRTERDSTAIPAGDTIYFDVSLEGNMGDTVTLKYRIAGVGGGSRLSYTIGINGVDEPWFNDSSFHEVHTTLAGKTAVVKFKPDNNDATLSRDVRFAIHDLPIYELDSIDYTNPNVLNIMAYNIQMIPFGISGMPQAALRSDLLPAQLSPWQDVVIFEEIFDDVPRSDHLVPAMTAAGFPYKTTILNDQGGSTIPWNGGVMIFSRWPIVAEDEIDFELCGQASADCLASKGIKYAQINKLGKNYHVFGTHMDAGGQADDIAAKRSQMAEMRDFIAARNIPEYEPVLFGGDFNVSPLSSDSLFFNMLDTLDPIIPHHEGFYESTFGDDSGKIIDNIWAVRTHLVPVEANNEIITLRSIQDTMWELSEFSDHRCAIGRFEYPDISFSGAGDTVLCPGESLDFSVTVDPGLSIQWLRDGQPIPGANQPDLSVSNATKADSGYYQCQLGYQKIFGNSTVPVVEAFYPFGPDTINAMPTINFGRVDVDSVRCLQIGIEEFLANAIRIYPNPTSDAFYVNIDKAISSASMKLLSSLGEVIKSVTLHPGINKIEASGLPKGMYLLSIHTEKGLLSESLIIR